MKWVSPVVGILLLLWGPELYGHFVMMQANAKLEGYNRIYKHEGDFVRALCQLYSDFAGLYSATTAAVLSAIYYVTAIGQTTLWKAIVVTPIAILTVLLIRYTRKSHGSRDMMDYVNKTAKSGPKHALRWFRIGVAFYAFVLAAASQWGK